MKLTTSDLKKLVLEEIEKTKKAEALKEKKAKILQEIKSLNEDEDTEMPMDGGDDEEHENYMFFSNLKQIKMMAEKLLSLDKDEIDEMLSDGHDWAQDHISTSKDDIEEVCNFFKIELDDEEEGGENEEIGGEIDFDVTETGDDELKEGWKDYVLAGAIAMSPMATQAGGDDLKTSKSNSSRKEFVINPNLKLANGPDYIEVITNDENIANKFRNEKEVLKHFSEMGKTGKQYVFIIGKSNKEYLINKLDNLNKELDEVEELDEKKLTKPQKEEKEKIVLAMKDKMKDFVKRYGKDRAKEVMYATATKMAKEKK
jgi:hypothetical protein